MLVSSDPEQINRPLVDQPNAFTQPSWPSITVDRVLIFRSFQTLSVKYSTPSFRKSKSGRCRLMKMMFQLISFSLCQFALTDRSRQT